MVTAVTVWPIHPNEILQVFFVNICISTCYTITHQFPSPSGHMVTAVTVWPFIPQQHYLYIVINICISICYIFFYVILALCGHMVTAVTMWPWLCDRDCDQIVSSAISSCFVNDCISMYYIRHDGLSSLTAVTRSQLWPCDRDHVTVSLWHRKMQNAQTTIRRSKVRNYLLTYALSRHETPCFVWRKMVIHGKKRCIIFALLRFLLYLCKRNGERRKRELTALKGKRVTNGHLFDGN